MWAFMTLMKEGFLRVSWGLRKFSNPGCLYLERAIWRPWLNKSLISAQKARKKKGRPVSPEETFGRFSILRAEKITKIFKH